MAAFCIYNFTAFNGEKISATPSRAAAADTIIPSVLVWRRT
jgi:hypothetical protein